MRTPALSWNVAERWTEGVDGDAHGDEVAVLRGRLRTIVRDPLVQLALYIASPSLHQRLGPWLAGHDGHLALRVEPAVVRYVMRMIGRPTPFGLFAGSAVGIIGPNTRLTVPGNRACVRHSRLDFDVLLRLADRMGRDPHVRSELRYHAPSEAYVRAGALRYVTTRGTGRLRSYDLMEAELTGALQTALDFVMARGGTTFSEIATHLATSIDGIDLDGAVGFVDELIDAQLLRSDLGPAVTGEDALGSVNRALKEAPSAKSVVAVLDRTRVELARIDGAGVEAGPPHYQKANDILRALTRGEVSHPSIHVDLYKPSHDLMLGEEIIEDVIEGVELLQRLGTERVSPLQHFAERFQKRYGELEVPLLDALDETSGLSFDSDSGAPAMANALLEGLSYRGERLEQAQWTQRDATLLEGLYEIWRSEGMEMPLTDRMVAALPLTGIAPLPISCSALIAVSATSGAAIERRDYRVLLKAVFGRGCAALLGRFCLGSREITEQVKMALRREEDAEPDAIHAEIAYLPHGRAGNVVSRPVLRRYEIDLFGGSGASTEQRIALNDLLLSFRSGRFRLISRKHGRRSVVPHLTCAHAFSKSDPAHYRFLACLSEIPSPHLKFSWGALRTAPFLPRLSRGRLVLAPARWNVGAQHLKALHASQGRERSACLRKLRGQLRLPRYINLYEGDQTLVIDLENALSVDSFLAAVRSRATVTLSEMFPPPGQMCAQGVEGRYTNELIVPFQQMARTSGDARRDAESWPPANSVRSADDKWLFAKVYCTRIEADELLSAIILPFVSELSKQGLIECWHFLRYADPDWHLRLRLRGRPTLLYQQVAPALLTRLRHVNTVAPRIAFDTYRPEYTRYGGEAGMDIAERIFEVDSWAAASLIEKYSGDQEARWQLALLGMDSFFEAGGFDVSAREKAVAKSLAYHMALHKDATLNRQLGFKFRRLRPVLETMFALPSSLHAVGARILNERSESLRPLMSQLHNLERKGELSKTTIEVVQSCLHMWANRMFSDTQNVQELVLNALLKRWYAYILHVATQGKSANP